MIPVWKEFQTQLAESEFSNRAFGLCLGGVLLAMGLSRPFHSGLHGGAIRWGPLALGALVLTLAAFVPHTLRSLKQAWLFLGCAMGFLISPVVLGLLFFLVISPAGMAMRMFRRDALSLRLDPRAATYWRERKETLSDMRLQF